MSRTKNASHACRMSRHQLCALNVGLGKLMCRDHWYMVPAELRNRINALWGESGGDIMSLSPQYFDAVREAEDAVKAKLAAV